MFKCFKFLAHRKIKIDNSFIQGIPRQKENEKMISCISSVANQFNYGLIAEGVSDSKQERFLLERGCKEAQGFYYYKPLTAEAIARELTKIKDSSSAKA